MTFQDVPKYIRCISSLEITALVERPPDIAISFNIVCAIETEGMKLTEKKCRERQKVTV